MKTSAELIAFCCSLEAPRAWTLKELMELDVGEASAEDQRLLFAVIMAREQVRRHVARTDPPSTK